MKKIWTVSLALCIALFSFSQADTTGKETRSAEADTIKVGGITIIRKGGKEKDAPVKKEIEIAGRKQQKKSSNLSTNWWIVDLGFANYTDNTNYSSLAARQFAPGSNEDWFQLKNEKSSNVNIWFFMQKLNVIKKVVNLKYGLGLELNNYRYKSPIKYQANPTKIIYDDTTKYSKNKLAADYVTVPLLLNFNFTPERRKGFGFSAGASAGYLYGSRQKTITEADGKNKERDDFNLRRFKLSYIGELQLGPVKLYGSLASKSMFEKGLDQTPYNLGIRFSKW